MNELKNKKLFLLDMDGTLYLGNEIFKETYPFLAYIKNIGGRYIFLTNNSSRGVDKYIEKLKSFDIPSKEDDFFTSTDATVIYLKNQGYKKIYALGTKSFAGQLKDSGLNVTIELENDIDCLCMGFDTELTFKKLEDACKLLKNDIAYIATNPDWVCPTEYGYVPDCGSVSEMLKRATGKSPHFIGKPRPEMINYAIEKSGFEKEQAIIFGDRLYTDICAGYNAGITTAFVLSGEGTLKDVEESEAKPDFILDSVGDFLKHVDA